jgi:hypothetical protein
MSFKKSSEYFLNAICVQPGKVVGQGGERIIGGDGVPDGDIYFCCGAHMLVLLPSLPPVVAARFPQLPTGQNKTPRATLCSQLYSDGRIS